MYFLISDLLEEKGHEVIHFSTHSEMNESSPTSEFFVEDPNFQNRPFLKKALKSPSYIYSRKSRQKLRQLLEKEKPDIAHLHIFFGELSLSILPELKKHNIPVVMSLHEYKMLCSAYTLYDRNGSICELCSSGNHLHSIKKKCTKGSFFSSCISALECYVRDEFIPYDKYIDRFISVSQFSMNKHLEFRPELQDKISYIYNFTDSEPVSTILSDNYFVYFGRLSREKGIETLIKAFARLPELKLKIIGDGTERNDYERLVEELGVQNIEFCGFKRGKELNDEIIRAKFCIIHSEWYETFGLTVIESMLCGTPPISSGLGGMSELIEDQKTGFIFKPKKVDDLVRVLGIASNMSPTQYHKMATKCLTFASRNFNKEKYYSELITIYTDLLKTTNI